MVSVSTTERGRVDSLGTVSALTLHRGTRRSRWRRAAFLIAAAVCVSLALHHVDVGGFDGAHHDAGVETVVELCLGVLTVVATAAAAVPAGFGARLLRRAFPRVPPPAVPWRRPHDPRARAGPAIVSFLCVDRR